MPDRRPFDGDAQASDPARRAKVIEVTNFCAAYGGKIVLKEVNFTVRRGEVLFIAGDSGSGKSTVLRHLIGLQVPADGTLLIDGENLFKATGGARERILRKFGVSFQSGALFGGMTVLENVKLQLTEFAKVTDDQADVIALAKLQMVGLADSAQEMPSELSGGMQKRAAIARAMALDPMILFMDEPSAGLDPINSAELDLMIKSLNRLLGMTFVIVSHELASIMGIADRALLFSSERKTLVAEGDPRKLGRESKDAWVRAFFERDGGSVETTKREAATNDQPATGGTR